MMGMMMQVAMPKGGGVAVQGRQWFCHCPSLRPTRRLVIGRAVQAMHVPVVASGMVCV